MYRNSKHYPDPTAGAAFAHISHEKRWKQKNSECKRQTIDNAKIRKMEPIQLTMSDSLSESRLVTVASECVYTGNKPFQDLAVAVIRQAIYDYLALGRRLHICKCRDDMRKTENKMKAISRFFLGRWYSTLSGNIDGGMILEALDREVFGDD